MNGTGRMFAAGVIVAVTGTIYPAEAGGAADPSAA